jgi:hypothetical protein
VKRLLSIILGRPTDKEVALAKVLRTMGREVKDIGGYIEDTRQADKAYDELKGIISSGLLLKEHQSIIDELEEELEEKREEIASLTDESKVAGQLVKARSEVVRLKDRLDEYRDRLFNLLNALPHLVGKGKSLGAVAPYLAATQFIRNDQQQHNDFFVPPYTLPEVQGLKRGQPTYDGF